MRFRIILFLLLVIAAPARGADLNGSCEVFFLGTSTLHDFSGTAPCQPFTLSIERGAQGGQMVQSGAVVTPVSGMDTDNRRRDKKLREMFQSEQFPHIEGTFVSFDIGEALRLLRASDDGSGHLQFGLSIRNRERLIRANVENFSENPEQIAFDMEFEVSLQDYRLKPPSVLGLIRVGDMVKVKVEVKLDKSREGATADLHELQ